METTIKAGGSNLCSGERFAISLAKATVKSSPIVLIDEATAVVDPATDSRIQAAIRSKFKGKTLLAIAHRLSTMIGYDRIIVMDDGRVERSPEELWELGGRFREMCEHSWNRKEDIENAKQEVREAG